MNKIPKFIWLMLGLSVAVYMVWSIAYPTYTRHYRTTMNRKMPEAKQSKEPSKKYIDALKAENDAVAKEAADSLNPNTHPLQEQDNYCIPWRHLAIPVPISFPAPVWSSELQKKAEQGDVNAERTIGYIYRHGSGVKKDDTEAVKWFSKAADRGDNWAQGHLGEMYEFGLGVKVDHKKAYYLLSLVSVQGVQWTRDWCQRAESNLSSGEVSEVREDIKKWVKEWNQAHPAPAPK